MDHAPAHDDPHPDDAEFERLLAYIGAALRVPEGETYAQRTERQERLRALFDALWRLQYPGWDNPAAPPPEPLPAPNWIVCDPPLVATPPAWRTSLTSYDGPEAERADRAEADAIIARAIEDAHAALDANKRAEPPRRVALQILDHHLVRGVPLFPRALELVGRALRIDPKRITAALRRARIREGEVGTEALAAEWGISRQAVEQLRDKQVDEPETLMLFLDLHRSTEQGQPPRRSTRDDIARLLAQHGKPGRWPDETRRAARVEAQRRAKAKRRARDIIREAGNQNADDAVAKAETLCLMVRNRVDAVAKVIRADPRKVERWMARDDWEWAVLLEAVEVRGDPRPDANRIIDYNRDEGGLRLMTRAESSARRQGKHRADR